MIYMTMIPFGFYYFVIKHSPERLHSDEFTDKYGSLYTDLKTTKSGLFQVFWYMFRRLIFTFTIVFLGFSPFLQANIVIISSYLSLLYLVVYRPYEEKITAYFEIYNEVTLLLVSYGMLMNCDFISSDAARYNLGWFLSGVLILNIFLNFLNVAIKMG